MAGVMKWGACQPHLVLSHESITISRLARCEVFRRMADAALCGALEVMGVSGANQYGRLGKVLCNWVMSCFLSLASILLRVSSSAGEGGLGGAFMSLPMILTGADNRSGVVSIFDPCRVSGMIPDWFCFLSPTQGTRPGLINLYII